VSFFLSKAANFSYTTCIWRHIRDDFIPISLRSLVPEN